MLLNLTVQGISVMNIDSFSILSKINVHLRPIFSLYSGLEIRHFWYLLIIHLTLLYLHFSICKLEPGRTVPLSVLFIRVHLVEYQMGLVPAHFVVTLWESKWDFKNNLCSSVVRSFPLLSWKILSLLYCTLLSPCS